LPFADTQLSVQGFSEEDARLFQKALASFWKRRQDARWGDERQKIKRIAFGELFSGFLYEKNIDAFSLSPCFFLGKLYEIWEVVFNFVR
jgi:hypothetical protein